MARRSFALCVLLVALMACAPASSAGARTLLKAMPTTTPDKPKTPRVSSGPKFPEYGRRLAEAAAVTTTTALPAVAAAELELPSGRHLLAAKPTTAPSKPKTPRTAPHGATFAKAARKQAKP